MGQDPRLRLQRRYLHRILGRHLRPATGALMVASRCRQYQSLSQGVNLSQDPHLNLELTSIFGPVPMMMIIAIKF